MTDEQQHARHHNERKRDDLRRGDIINPPGIRAQCFNPQAPQRIPDEVNQKQIAFFELAGQFAPYSQEQDNAGQTPQ